MNSTRPKSKKEKGTRLKEEPKAKNTDMDDNEVLPVAEQAQLELLF
jgi:hypothetical protein